MPTLKRPAPDGPIRVGLLGAGGIADEHARALRSLAPGVELVAVADVDTVKAQRLAERWNVASCFSSVEPMLASARLDVVHVLLPSELHAAFAIRCMDAGAHVFVEKPLCISAAECRELQHAAVRYERAVGVNHNVTFEPAFLRLIEVIGRRRLGAIQHVSVSWSVRFGLSTFGTPLYRRAGQGAVILDTGPHPMSLIVRLLGEAKSASAVVSAEMQSRPDTWRVSLDCERGTAQAFIAIGRPFMDTRVHVIGEDGWATADLRLGYVCVAENTRYSAFFSKFGDAMEQARSIAAAATQGLAVRLRRVRVGGATDDAAAVFRASIIQFYQSLRAGREPTASLAEGLAVVRSCLRVVAAGCPALGSGGEVEPWPATGSS